ncbi:uncharacterized protein LOC119083877 [Bradysia coprophila]|uniref:uncharacterized protein LOC119083877 n=1 Tax=Bradysia coprophila TaxID=38358 RepID=UPI00187DC694|nr:uncharacterized protein LOC119083877 [Bradysia coprophila]XP_037049586.1 uncharacterized protein LOC119083877 [Bradysia coprophila]
MKTSLQLVVCFFGLIIVSYAQNTEQQYDIVPGINDFPKPFARALGKFNANAREWYGKIDQAMYDAHDAILKKANIIYTQYRNLATKLRETSDAFTGSADEIADVKNAANDVLHDMDQSDKLDVDIIIAPLTGRPMMGDNLMTYPSEDLHALLRLPYDTLFNFLIIEKTKSEDCVKSVFSAATKYYEEKLKRYYYDEVLSYSTDPDTLFKELDGKMEAARKGANDLIAKIKICGKLDSKTNCVKEIHDKYSDSSDLAEHYLFKDVTSYAQSLSKSLDFQAPGGPDTLLGRFGEEYKKTVADAFANCSS